MRLYRVDLFQVHKDGTRSLALTDTQCARRSLRVYRQAINIGRAYVRDNEWRSWCASRQRVDQ